MGRTPACETRGIAACFFAAIPASQPGAGFLLQRLKQITAEFIKKKTVVTT
jgi:hypothetical protein